MLIGINFSLMVYILFWIKTEASACDKGWFGKMCQYQCHCTNNNCDVNGECKPGSSCEREWFGPACQYQDLFSLSDLVKTPNADVLRDNDESTCWQYPDDTLTIRFGTEFSITWIRVQLRMSDLSRNIKLTLVSSNDVLHTCSKTSLLENGTFDIFCDANTMADRLMVSRAYKINICSLYISGGRNVALRQSALQSSIYKNKGITFDASLAVDGKRQSDFNSSSCAHTDLLDPSPNWNVTLSKTHLVNRYVIYNSNEDQDLLQNFILSSLNSDDIIVDNYIVPKIAHAIYYGTSVSLNVSFIKIYTHENNKVLRLCEVEIYGDSLCPVNLYGMECDKHCNCENKTETCYVATGGCPSGCASGFFGPGCQNSCPVHKWGVDCLNKCSEHCIDGMCDKVDGSCDYGCQEGFTGPHCIEGFSCSDRFGFGIGIGIAIMLVTGTLLTFIIPFVLMRFRKHRNYGLSKENVTSEQNPAVDIAKNKYDSLNLFEDSAYALPSIPLDRIERNSTNMPHHKDNAYDEI